MRGIVISSVVAIGVLVTPQARLLLDVDEEVSIKRGTAGEVWHIGSVVHSMPPGPCLGVLISQADGFKELVTDFDSLRVERDGKLLVRPRQDVALRAPQRAPC